MKKKYIKRIILPDFEYELKELFSKGRRAVLVFEKGGKKSRRK